MPKKLIIDADPGIGDALAIAIVLCDPELDLIGVTATAGRTSGPNATRNIQAVVDWLDPPKHPRIGASDVPLPEFAFVPGIDRSTFLSINGPNGLADFNVSVAELHHPHESAKLMVDLVRNHPHEVTLLTLGPLTNVELACELEPQFFDLVSDIVCLGGSVSAGGDITAAAEFNVFASPQAARAVLRSPATKTLVPLDASQKPVLTFRKYDQIKSDRQSRLTELLEQILPYAFRAYHQVLGEEGIRIHAIVALASISRPNLFTREPMAIDVETEGDLTRGATVFDRRHIKQWQTNIDVVTDVDKQGVTDYFHNVIRNS